MTSLERDSAATNFAAWEQANAAFLRRVALFGLLIGVLCRLVRFALSMPFYGDETMLLVNYLTRSYGDMFGQIENGQIAPLLFHWVEIAVFQHLSTFRRNGP